MSAQFTLEDRKLVHVSGRQLAKARQHARTRARNADQMAGCQSKLWNVVAALSDDATTFGGRTGAYVSNVLRRLEMRGPEAEQFLVLLAALDHSGAIDVDWDRFWEQVFRE